MNVIAEKLRQAYHNDLTDVPLLLDGADEIDRLREALEKINGWSEAHPHILGGIGVIARTALAKEAGK